MNDKIKGARFHHIALRATDFEKTITFYKEIGFNEIARWDDGEKQGAMLEIGDGGIFEIFSGGSDEPEQNTRYFHLAIYTDNPDEAYELALKAGAKSHIAPKNHTIPADKPIDIRIAFVLGPSGEQLEFFRYK